MLQGWGCRIQDSGFRVMEMCVWYFFMVVSAAAHLNYHCVGNHAAT